MSDEVSTEEKAQEEAPKEVKSEGKPKSPNYCGMVHSKRLNREIAVFHKKGESCKDAMERIAKKHEQ
jgi:hypothetical protein